MRKSYDIYDEVDRELKRARRGEILRIFGYKTLAVFGLISVLLVVYSAIMGCPTLCLYN